MKSAYKAFFMEDPGFNVAYYAGKGAVESAFGIMDFFVVSI